jgi:hypothetical protein
VVVADGVAELRYWKQGRVVTREVTPARAQHPAAEPVLAVQM